MDMTRIGFAVILAGGEGRRMGSDKTRVSLGGKPLIRHVIERVGPQSDGILISCHDEPNRFRDLGYPVVADELSERLGPIGGILSAMDRVVAEAPETEFILTVPTDTPFLPNDLVRRLTYARDIAGLPMACACSGDQIHPTIAIWPVAIRETLRRSLERAPERSVRNWTRRIGCAYAIWRNEPYDPFFNVNTPEDLEKAELQKSEQDDIRVSTSRHPPYLKTVVG